MKAQLKLIVVNYQGTNKVICINLQGFEINSILNSEINTTTYRNDINSHQDNAKEANNNYYLYYF